MKDLEFLVGNAALFCLGGDADLDSKSVGREITEMLKNDDVSVVEVAECSFTVGQMVIVKDDGDDDGCPRVAKFLGEEARVIGICNDIHGDPVVTIHHETRGYLTLQSYAFAPL